MRKISFVKMQAAGNDYVYINCFGGEAAAFAGAAAKELKGLVIKLSNRNYGIGGDGVIFICPSEAADAKMRMFNADGSEGRMCGNGIRCVAKYVYDNIAAKDQLTIETLSGVKQIKCRMQNAECKIKDDNNSSLLIPNSSLFTVDMGAAEWCPAKIPVKVKAERVVDYAAVFGRKEYRITCVSMGNPHCVVFEDNIDLLDLPDIGPKFENNKIFPERVNTEFVEIIDGKTLKMRVWERGSGETLACGTGACAAVAAAVINGVCKAGDDVRVILKGGELIVNYTDGRVLMTGDAVKVFEGTAEV